MAVALTVLGGVVALTTLQLRKGIRQQITGRDAEVLYAVAMQHYSEDVERGLGGPVGTAGDPLGVVLRSAELRGVLGVRLFDAQGHFVECFPPDLMEGVLDPGMLPSLLERHPVSRFHAKVGLWTFFYPDEAMDFSHTVPLLEVNVPLHEEGGPLAGVAQFLIEGHSIAAEFARLDRRLAIQALSAFVVGGGILTLALAWAFHRLNRAHHLLTERTANLARANQELVLAAKTSALGAVTAHLIHGLKNPLSGLQNFMASRSTSAQPPEEADWEQAVASTRRMQSMINHVVGVLREDQAGTAYAVTASELEEMVRVRVHPLARERGVEYAAVVRSGFSLPNRTANLVALILVNLCENAVQATPQGKKVTLEAQTQQGHLQFTVRDEGPGFPADVPLFMPCRSTKEQGTGVGLALCKQLANHLDATLELARSTAEGCVFHLTLITPAAEPGHTRQDRPARAKTQN
jgi:signal transduction histidine kinase